ncbi:MAG TPA: cell division protein CrgA [Streptosporangiaceae bacterium]
MPKSKVRKKAVYTPPPRSSKSKVSPPWLAPTMVGCLVLGLAWIATFYISSQNFPISALHQWNLVVGFGLIVSGVMLATRWH